MDVIKGAVKLPFGYHLVVGIGIRIVLVFYGEMHDAKYDVPYTDVDYKVFTDAARHVLDGNSPYLRHTYRYSPLVAYLLIPNLLVGKHFGKLLFSLFDVLVAVALKALVQHKLRSKDASEIAKCCAFFWLYNPLSIGISTRGNADSVPCLFVILSLLFLQTEVVRGLFKYFLAGVLLAFSIHLRLYPLAFSFPMYLSLGEYKINRTTSVTTGLISLLPNKKQLVLAASCIATLFLITYALYSKYGYEFLFETYLYHVFRKDTRHNFSVLFYHSYLTMGVMVLDVVKMSAQIIELVILFMLSLAFGCDTATLPFAMFCQAVVLVAFNSVMTSQYFIWFLSLLPLVVHNFELQAPQALVLVLMWLGAQSAWLFYAYLLEFKSREIFVLIWLKGIVFFCTNIYVLAQLIKRYNPKRSFGRNVGDVKTK